MATTAKVLLFDMNVRLKMQEEGITSPPQSIKDVTRQLVSELKALVPEEVIDVVVVSEAPLHARYIRAKTGQVLAEIHGQNT
ncbi:MAG: hypothetical protein Q7R66_12480 [Undibacterium sp.]|uniref:hypothetical protein n=1 Tax=Undibacterium sp. TaxID=1914977 RepID=UPI0027244E3D|nr:hypothetical protein [Undibacterium sp.]MDO8652996.1 hypothetical protein [Undibacterium sp.]